MSTQDYFLSLCGKELIYWFKTNELLIYIFSKTIVHNLILMSEGQYIIM